MRTGPNLRNPHAAALALIPEKEFADLVRLERLRGLRGGCRHPFCQRPTGRDFEFVWPGTAGVDRPTFNRRFQ